MIIFNLDGTLAEYSHRVHLLKPPNIVPRWEEFYAACDQDEPIEYVRYIMEALYFTHNPEIEVWTTRRENVRDKTTEWLIKHFRMGVFIKKLRMRSLEDDTRWDCLKESWANEVLESGKEIHFVVDCDSSMWKRKNIPVFKNFSKTNSKD